jgi:hypothetical protein
MFKESEGTIQKTGNVGHTKHRTKTNKAKNTTLNNKLHKLTSNKVRKQSTDFVERGKIDTPKKIAFECDILLGINEFKNL